MMTFLNVLLTILFAYTGINILYLSLTAFAGLLRREKTGSEPDEKLLPRMLVMLPGYKEDVVIIESAKASLQQNYPASRYEVVVIADSLRPETIVTLRSLPLHVIEVSFDVSTKAKALQVAVSQLPNNYDVAVVLDADNIMAADCLMELSRPFLQGWKVVQGHRTAKNVNTSVAVLDAISEEINNHLFRKGQRAIGLSAALIGSGMAFDYELFKSVLPEVQVVSGFDKELEMVLLGRRVGIEYVESAIILDEKVQNEAVFEKQRTRWMAAQIRVLRTYFVPGVKGLLSGNIDLANKVFQAMLLPRILLLGVLSIGLVISLVFGQIYWLSVTAIQLLLVLVIFYVATPSWLRKKVGMTELFRLPVLFGRFIRSLLKFRQARDRFIHTPHGIQEKTNS